MRIANGFWDAMANRDDDRAYYTLTGDLGQMGTMYGWLLDHGYPVVKRDVYPGFTKNDEDHYVQALKDIFHYRVDGWWNQERDLVKYEVASQEQFDQALGRTRTLPMSDSATTTRLSRAELERNAGTVQRLKDAGMEYDITGYDYLVSGLATDALAYMTALEKAEKDISFALGSVLTDAALLEDLREEIRKVLAVTDTGQEQANLPPQTPAAS